MSALYSHPQILLTHQLSEHERFLARYVHAFHEVDADRCGLLTQRQFLHSLELLFPCAPPSSFQLFANCSELIDPFSHNRISFSQVRNFCAYCIYVCRACIRVIRLFVSFSPLTAQTVEFLTSSSFLSIQPILMGGEM